MSLSGRVFVGDCGIRGEGMEGEGWRVRGWKGVRGEGVVKVAHLHLIGCGMKVRGGE